MNDIGVRVCVRVCMCVLCVRVIGHAQRFMHWFDLEFVCAQHRMAHAQPAKKRRVNDVHKSQIEGKRPQFQPSFSAAWNSPWDPAYDSGTTMEFQATPPHLQQQTGNDMQLHCAGCGDILEGARESGAKKVCRGCNVAHYCTLICQKSHWDNDHKLSCKVLMSARETQRRALRAVEREVITRIVHMQRSKCVSQSGEPLSGEEPVPASVP